MLGAGALAGIGFTMSLFVANLAFGPTPVLETAKVGILAAPIAAGAAGAFILSKTNTGATLPEQNALVEKKKTVVKLQFELI
jgi:Na+/H+ antiporter NhaA